MPDDKKESNSQISEDALEALLAQWAEAEIEPPADFHEKTMARLRLEQPVHKTKEKSGQVIPFFIRKKKWMSVVAAAVLVVCCIPVLQAQLGDGSMTNPLYDSLPGQNQPTVTDNEEIVATDETSGAATASNLSETADDPVDASQPSDGVDVAAAQTEQQATKNVAASNPVVTGVATVTEQTTTEGSEDAPAAATAPAQTVDGSATDSQLPAIASYSLGDPISDVSTGADNQNLIQGRSVPEATAVTQATAESYQAALDELTVKMEELQEELEVAEAKQKENPDDAEQKKVVEDIQQEIDTLEKEIEHLTVLVEEASS